MGNDVFFYNDKSGRVERINNGKSEGSNSSYSSLMESMITSDAQQSAHDSAWLRRPRSKYSRWGELVEIVDDAVFVEIVSDAVFVEIFNDANCFLNSRSRPITPVLSRQNSMSMDDISQVDKLKNKYMNLFVIWNY